MQVAASASCYVACGLSATQTRVCYHNVQQHLCAQLMPCQQEVIGHNLASHITNAVNKFKPVVSNSQLQPRVRHVQAMKAQALTLLATWVVADPSHSVAGRIRQQELPARILEDLVNRAHVFLPGPHGQMAVQVSYRVAVARAAHTFQSQLRADCTIVSMALTLCLYAGKVTTERILVQREVFVQQHGSILCEGRLTADEQDLESHK